ncbi:MAG: hypothetical protein AB8I69_10480 [Anaerolineae bacterium]
MPEPFSSLGESWLWLGGSLLFAILWANLAWYFRQPRSGPIGEFVTRVTSWRFAPLLLQFLRLLYYIGLPATAFLWRHAIVQRYLGLSSGLIEDVWLEWAHETGWAAALGFGAWALLALGWWTYRRALHAAEEKSPVDGTNASGWTLLREAAYHEVHWAFYRNAPVILALKQFGGEEYWGAWIGLALVALEATLNPAWRKGLADPEKAPMHLMRGALAVVSGAFFILTKDGNLLLALLLHFGVSSGLSILVRIFPLLPPHRHEQAQAPATDSETSVV